ncbi:ThiF family adenylyltransferase [Streptomyces sp. XD-27]|uniref:ThiF family adenylyltransferase n=1 Tax=Streptomyces sp. XD-27 TaxID=3062779 RepID=UPI0026F44985|nr:ThiF family adenylyltransferase [Streptomyces sp. XD-27]WKX72473.1 ThiF family adenylyltransferase [Streptomyces sp. XD-27]
MHPMLKPALRRGWRNRDTVQFGVTAAHAVVMGPMDTATGTFLELLDGTRDLPLLRREAQALGLPESRADALVDRLGAAGLLDDPTGGGEPGTALRTARGALDRLRPDLAAASVLHPVPGAAMRVLGARRSMRVHVRGAGRVGAAVAALLSAAGVGRVEVLDGGCVEPWDVTPAGLAADQVGERRDVAARRLVRRAAPAAQARRRSGGTPAAAEPGLALTVIAPRDGLAAYAPEPAEVEQLLGSGAPHLYAGVIEATGVVGPLVVPGVTPCAGCVAADRAEREPYWGRLLAQWRSGRRPAVPACDTALATVVAGVTAAHALSFLDGQLPPTAGSRLELVLPALTWHARSIRPHRNCGCGAGGSADEGYASAAQTSHATMAG